MAAYVFETDLTLGNEAESVPALVDPFRVPLDVMSGSSITLDPLTNVGDGGSAMMARLFAGTIKFAYGSANRIPTESDEFIFAHLFGMEVQEFCSWWYSGGGDAHIAAQIATLGGGADDVVVYPINVSSGESGGWYKEAVTMKKMIDGKWSDGTDIKIRLADEAKVAHLKAFPAVQTPAPVLSGSWLQDAKNGVFNCGEYNSPLGDSSVANGMFPNYPSGVGGITELLKHYYIGSWQTPFRGRCLFVNKTFHDSLPASEQAMIKAAAYQCHMQNMSYQLQGQDAIIKQFQSFGAIIHEQLPNDYQMALRQAVDEIYTEEFGGKGAQYAATRDHQRAFISANQVRWRSGGMDRRARFQSRLNYEADLQTNS